jgi:hypothetical protein
MPPSSTIAVTRNASFSMAFRMNSSTIDTVIITPNATPNRNAKAESVGFTNTCM